MVCRGVGMVCREVWGWCVEVCRGVGMVWGWCVEVWGWCVERCGDGV